MENAPPDSPIGAADSASNVFYTPPGKAAVRGGSQVKRTLTAQRILYLRPFTPVGAIAVAHADSATKHYLFRLTTDMAFYTGSEATSYHDLIWNSATPARPHAAELFERLYVADATTGYSARHALKVVQSDGTVASVSHDLGGGSEAMKPYVVEEYNSHLFTAGYDNKTLAADAPHMVRHSYLGVEPSASGGFDANAYLVLGARGQRVTGLKKGRGLLLATKANEMYRISGFGRGVAGWQFQVEQVNNTLGLGVSNPLALCFAGEYWYGIGESGPFRTNGFDVESLVGARKRSWSKVTNLTYSWCSYHPDRDCVLFGLNQTPVPSGRSATYPTVIWVWDCQREVWAGDITCSADVHYAHAIPTATVQGPTAAPSALAVTHASATLTGITVTWTNGDATAATEVWLRDKTTGGSYYLWSTVAAGLTTTALGSLTAGRNYEAKIRHIKSGVVTDFADVADAYTLIPPPSLVGVVDSYMDAEVTVAAGDLTFEKDTVVVETRTIAEVGAIRAATVPLTGSDYRARITNTAWPVAIQASAYSNVAPPWAA